MVVGTTAVVDGGHVGNNPPNTVSTTVTMGDIIGMGTKLAPLSVSPCDATLLIQLHMIYRYNIIYNGYEYISRTY